MPRFMLIVLSFVTIPIAGEAAAVETRLESALRQIVERGDMRAAAAGLYADGEWSVVTVGRVSAADATPPDADTVFEIGSVSKVFTALLIQAQVKAGRLHWDDRLAERLPDFAFASDAVAAITLRELASHASGLPRNPDNMPQADPLDPYADYGEPELRDYLRRYQPESLDKSYDYSNLGAGLLGLVAARAAGLPFDRAMQRDVLEPLEMHDTAIALNAEQKARQAAGYSQGADMPNWSGFDALAGAGALDSTVADLMHFVDLNLADDGSAPLLAAIRDIEPHGETALGWHVDRAGTDDPVYWHNGGTGGYASFLAIRPATRTGIVLLTTSTEYMAVTDLGMAVIHGRDTADVTGDLDVYTGEYRLGEAFHLDVFVRGSQLFARATGQAEFPLTATAADNFLFPAADIRIEFERTEDGGARALTLHQAGRATPAPRIGDANSPTSYETIPVDAATLADYVGRYQLTPDIVIRVLARDSQLYVQLTDQGAIPVFPHAADRFFYRAVDATLEFERDESGAVTGVVLHQQGAQRAPRID